MCCVNACEHNTFTSGYILCIAESSHNTLHYGYNLLQFCALNDPCKYYNHYFNYCLLKRDADCTFKLKPLKNRHVCKDSHKDDTVLYIHKLKDQDGEYFLNNT